MDFNLEEERCNLTLCDALTEASANIDGVHEFLSSNQMLMVYKGAGGIFEDNLAARGST